MKAPISARGCHAIIKALREGPHVTKELRDVVREVEGHTQGLTQLLDYMLRQNLVRVEHHGDLEKREIWTWLGLNMSIRRRRPPPNFRRSGRSPSQTTFNF